MNSTCNSPEGEGVISSLKRSAASLQDPVKHVTQRLSGLNRFPQPARPRRAILMKELTQKGGIRRISFDIKLMNGRALVLSHL